MAQNAFVVQRSDTNRGVDLCGRLHEAKESARCAADTLNVPMIVRNLVSKAVVATIEPQEVPNG